MLKTECKVKIFGATVLRKKAQPVRLVGPEHRDILSAMAQTMYDCAGIGLAAPQIGISQQMIVVDIGAGLYKLINPRIVKRQGAQAIEEGCLSVPGVSIKVKRSLKVTVKGLDENGNPVTVEAQDLLACVFQHELDHLAGRLIIDYASFFDRAQIKRRLEELEKKTQDERLSESKEQSRKLQL